MGSKGQPGAREKKTIWRDIHILYYIIRIIYHPVSIAAGDSINMRERNESGRERVRESPSSNFVFWCGSPFNRRASPLEWFLTMCIGEFFVIIM